MGNLSVKGHEISLRADGSIMDVNDWTPELAEQIAMGEGLELTPAHWDVINTMRDYYHEYNTSPILKLLRREMVKKYGVDRATDEEFSRLFPGGVQYQGTRIAGVPLAYLDAELEQTTHIHAVQSGGEAPPIPQFEFEGKPVRLHSTGNLENQADWNERMAQALAQREGIELTDEHWVVINFLRKFYFQYGITPMVKVLIKHMSDELGPPLANKEHMYELFPGGPARQGSRIAGLPSPQGCIDP